MKDTIISNKKLTLFNLNKWSILPEKEQIDKPKINVDRDLRYIHNQRVKGVCWPYVTASKFGWIIKSPLDVAIEPVEEYQVKCDSDELEDLGGMLDVNFWIKRGDVFLGIKPDGWFRVHQARINGVWQNLFIPNGEKTFEWRLGWGIECPEDYVLMILPIPNQKKIKVHPGILTNSSLKKFNESGLGMSLAFEPIEKATIKRNEPIAKIIAFPQEALVTELQVTDKEEN
ncbi:hypothetical protein ABEP42_24055 [Priestia megaterium]